MSNAVKLSVTIITLNEEKNIERCIRSVQGLADEILVVDSYSTDHTQEICERLGVQFMQNPFTGYIEQNNFALQQAAYDHVLAIDADEALSPKLYQSVQQVKQHWTGEGYRFNRLTNYCGQWIRHCGWYPDTKLRLWDRRKGHWSGVNPHYSVKLPSEASVQHLKGDLLHYSYYSITQHVQQIDKFSSIGAAESFRKNKKYNFLLHIVLNPLFAFVQKYFIQLGILDGFMGYIVCQNAAYYKFLKYVKLRELYKNQAPS